MLAQDAPVHDTLAERGYQQFYNLEFPESLATFRERLSKDPKGVQALLAIGESPVDRSLPPREWAPWMLVANQFFKLDESLNK